MMLMLSALAVPGVAQGTVRPVGFDELPRIGVGYVTNAPNMFLGGSAYFVADYRGGLGLYVDFKRSTSTPRTESDFIDSLTVSEVDDLGHERDFDDFAWWSVNGALVRPISPELMLYLGAGYTHEEVYYRYRSDDPDLGSFGRYWIADEEGSGGRLNVLGGAFLRVSRRIALQFGIELQPNGFTVGGSYSLPIP
ncbi:MAG TPA: hypothetical protein VMM12_09195 [Longimicrobiales bacterium]|nr:hypothetical protein [Longimicrobiales bacterium]